MGEATIWEAVAGWLAHLPVRLAYRIIWLSARLNLGSARLVYAAMWDANLSLPPLRDGGSDRAKQDKPHD